MRPEHKWNKTNNAHNSKRKRPQRRTGPLTNTIAATRNSSKSQSTKPVGSSPGATDVSSPVGEEGPTPRMENDKDDNDGLESPSKRRRANSLEPRRTSDNSATRWKGHDPMEALRRAIQSSPARNMEKRDAPAMDENTLTPKPVRRNLFPNSQNEGPLKALGESAVNSPRRSPRIASHSDKRSQDKENLGPDTQDDLDCLFEGPGFDFDLPASPTPKRRNPRANVLGEKRLALPYNSPTSRSRKNVDTESSPTKVTAQKLQRIQESPSRQNKTPKKARPGASDMPPFPESSNADLGSVVDIFDEDGAGTNTDFLFDPSWVPSDYVSPGSDDQPNGGANDDEDLINLILSDPGFNSENFRNSQVNPFDLDSGLFGSDFLDTSDKTKEQTQAQASSNDTSAS